MATPYFIRPKKEPEYQIKIGSTLYTGEEAKKAKEAYTAAKSISQTAAAQAALELATPTKVTQPTPTPTKPKTYTEVYKPTNLYTPTEEVRKAEYVSTSGVNPRQTDEGTWNPNYIPKSEEELADPALDPYTKNLWTANFYKSKGIDLKVDMPATWEEETEEFMQQQGKEMSYLDREIEYAKTKAKREIKESQSAIRTELSVAREGIVSTSNLATRDKIIDTMTDAYMEKSRLLDVRKEQLERMQEEQRKEWVEGRAEQIAYMQAAVTQAEADLAKYAAESKAETIKILDMLAENNALANLDNESLAYLSDNMPGIPKGVIRALGIASTRALQQEIEAVTFERGMEMKEASQSLLDLLDSTGALADLDAQSLAFIEAGLPGIPTGILNAISQAATRSMLKEDEKEKFDQQYKMYSVGEMMSQLTGTIHVPDIDGKLIDTKIPTVDLRKFESDEMRDLMRIKIISDNSRYGLAKDMINLYGSGASSYIEKLWGMPPGTLAGLQTVEELNMTTDALYRESQFTEFLLREGFINMNGEILDRYINAGGGIVKGGIGIDPLSLPDISEFIKNISYLTQSFKRPGIGGTDVGGGHNGIDIVFNDGLVHALRGGIVVGIEPTTGSSGYGNQILIQDETGLIWQYSHLGDKQYPEENPFAVKEGERINAGDILGKQGNTGYVLSTKSPTDPTYGMHTDIRIVGRLKPGESIKTESGFEIAEPTIEPETETETETEKKGEPVTLTLK